MQTTIRQLLILPVIVIAAYPCVATSTYFALFLAPTWMQGSSIRYAWIDAGLPIWIATHQIAFMQTLLPGIILMSVLSAGVFWLRSRIADAAVVVLLAYIPLVDTIELGLGLWYLRTQCVTALIIISVLVAYFIARRWVPVRTDPPTDWRLTGGLLGSYALVCSIFHYIVWA